MMEHIIGTLIKREQETASKHKVLNPGTKDDGPPVSHHLIPWFQACCLKVQDEETSLLIALDREPGPHE